MSISPLKIDILRFIQDSFCATTTQIIKWGLRQEPPTQSAERRCRELREEGYLSERPVNDDEMNRWGLNVRVSIFFLTEKGRVTLLRHEQVRNGAFSPYQTESEV